MAKEICISSTPHETRLAILEDDQLAEIYYERENEYTLAGSIYNGRVTRVLPGMQSAFVDLGLERDAFLYVTDFLEMEDQEEMRRTGKGGRGRAAISLRARCTTGTASRANAASGRNPDRAAPIQPESARAIRAGADQGAARADGTAMPAANPAWKPKHGSRRARPSRGLARRTRTTLNRAQA